MYRIYFVMGTDPFFMDRRSRSRSSLFYYAILFPILILNSLPDTFPIPIRILSFVPDPEPDPDPDHDILYI